MPGPMLATEAWDLHQRQLIVDSERTRLAQAIASRHQRRMDAGFNTCETSQCQCLEIARLVHNGFSA